MITLDYAIRNAPSESADLRHLGESELHYDQFLGDIIFRVNGSNMSASWGWIPIIDFAACLSRIAEELQPNQTESFEFTESEHRIDFTMREGLVEIRATYGGDAARVTPDELRQSTQEFLRRVLDDLCARNPSLAANPVVRRLYPKSLVSGAGSGQSTSQRNK
jgi:hypothetical protein